MSVMDGRRSNGSRPVSGGNPANGREAAQFRSQELSEAHRRSLEVRRRNAELKVEIGAATRLEGRGIAADVLESSVELYGALKVRHLLGSIRSWGEERVLRECRKADVSPEARLREVTPGRREHLVRILRDRRGM